MNYQFKDNRIKPPIEAQALGEELERIRIKNGGDLTPPAVVEESRPKKAVAHNCFTWNDKEAARLQRLSEARNLINVVCVVPEAPEGQRGPQQVLPAFVNVAEGQVGEQTRSYQSIGQILADPAKRQAMIQRCLEKLVRVRNEFAALQECASLWASVDEFVEEFGSP